MATSIQIRVFCEDDSDADWLKYRVTGAVEDIVEENMERMDGKVTVEWDTDTVN